MLINVTILAGDGVGPEVTAEAVGVLHAIATKFGHELKSASHVIGGAALLSRNDPFPEETRDACLSSHAVLLGAVGGPAFDKFPSQLRPERGLLRLRQALGVFAACGYFRRPSDAVQCS